MPFKKAAGLVLLLELLIAVLAVLQYGTTLEALQAVTRYSGRLSLGIFSVMFILLPTGEGRLTRLLSSKPFHAFAMAHGIHLAQLLVYVYLSGNDLIPIRLAGGFLAYLMIFVMPFVHTNYLSGQIDHKMYVIASTVYLYYVWFIFFMSYLPRVQGKLPNVGGNYWEFVVLLCWVCMMMGMKLSAIIFQRRSAP